MGFDPGLKLGQEIRNEELVKIFKCGNMGGMRRSRITGTLVIISDDTKGLYNDVWKNGILYYVGMGKIGDQVLTGNQNGTLYYSNTNGVEVHLFEVLQKTIYTYRGIVTLSDNPYTENQIDEEGKMRKVWVFPMKLHDKIEEQIQNPSVNEVIKLSNSELIRRSEMNGSHRKNQKTETTIYYRDPYIKELVKRIAEGKCQFCGKEAPFIDKNNEPYLEEHHVKWLADGGTDTIDNVVAICPNCHRKMHILNEKKDVVILEKIANENRKLFNRMTSYLKEISYENN